MLSGGYCRPHPHTPASLYNPTSTNMYNGNYNYSGEYKTLIYDKPIESDRRTGKMFSNPELAVYKTTRSRVKKIPRSYTILLIFRVVNDAVLVSQRSAQDSGVGGLPRPSTYHTPATRIADLDSTVGRIGSTVQTVCKPNTICV